MEARRFEDATLATEDLTSSRRSPRVLLVIGRSAVRAHALPERGELVLGRSRGADVVIDDRSVSRRHARLVLEGRQLSIADLGSANGTRIDHRPVRDAPIVVHPGEPFHLGAVTLVIDGAPDATGRAQRVPAAEAADEARPVDTMAELDAMARRLAAGGVSVLVQGETGAGKERMAERIHALSPRATGPFVRLSCAAIAESLLESELFGHERGAFTGADAAKPGLLEIAGGGTVFFDEVGELPLRLQVKLLRAVEERAVRRVGGTEPRPVDVRFISATNRDLEAEVEAERFRRDLYFRLAGATLFIPALRERRTEILPLADRFLGESAHALRRPVPRLGDEATAWLVRHDWPGNVRELRSACERAVLLCDDGLLRAIHFQTASRARASAPRAIVAPDPPPEVSPGESMPEAARREREAVERRRILAALDDASGNQTRAAELLGISRRTLVNRLGAYDLPRPRKSR